MKREGRFGPLFLIVILFSHTRMATTTIRVLFPAKLLKKKESVLMSVCFRQEELHTRS